MTGWLSDWLRDIVLIILLAAFVDLLIPNNTLQRYVKVVVSLIILLTVLSPVISLIKADLTPESALRQAAALQSEQPAQSMPELAAILRDGERLRQEREDQTLDMVAAEIELHATAETERMYPVRVVAADVRLAGRSGDEEPQVASIALVLAQPDTGEREDASSPDSGTGAAKPIKVEAVEAVARVGIAVSQSPGEQPVGLSGDSRDDEDDPQRNELARQISRFLAQYWGVAERNVQVAWQ